MPKLLLTARTLSDGTSCTGNSSPAGSPGFEHWHGSVELVSPQLWSVPVRGDVLVLVHDEVLDAGQLASLRPALVEILGADPATIAVAVDAERLSDISQERVALASQQPLR